MTSPSLPFNQIVSPQQVFSIELNSDSELAEIIRHAEGQFAISKDSNWLVGIAFLLWQQHQYSDALSKLENVPQSDRLFNIQYLLVYGMSARRIKGLEDNALKAFRRVILLDPTRSDVYYNLANLYRDYQEAHHISCRAFQICIDLDPNCSHYWINRAFSLNELDCSFEAINSFRKGLQLDPNNPDAWNNLGLSYYSQELYPQALNCFNQSISIDSNLPSAHINIANSYVEQGQADLALEPLSKAVEFSSKTDDSPNALWNMSLVNLLLGDFENGWRQYEARLSTKQFTDRQFPTAGPLLRSLDDAPNLSSKTSEHLLVWSEQGMGDSIQFCRYLLMLKSRNVPFQFMSRNPLLTLMKDWLGLGDLVIPDKSTDPQNDLRPHIPLMSLPFLFNTSLDTVPAFPQYLKKPGPTPSKFVLDPPPAGLNVGLVWASNPDNSAMYKRKSLPLKCLMSVLNPLLELGLINLHSLQFGDDSQQLEPWLSHPNVFHWEDQLSDFSDTAYLVEQLDLVLSVDTGVAHLSGALGISTWLLLPANADFRWLRSRDDTPWYPTMRIFRQSHRNDWPSVAARLQSAFDELFMLNILELHRSRHSQQLVLAN